MLAATCLPRLNWQNRPSDPVKNNEPDSRRKFSDEHTHTSHPNPTTSHPTTFDQNKTNRPPPLSTPPNAHNHTPETTTSQITGFDRARFFSRARFAGKHEASEWRRTHKLSKFEQSDNGHLLDRENHFKTEPHTNATHTHPPPTTSAHRSKRKQNKKQQNKHTPNTPDGTHKNTHTHENTTTHTHTPTPASNKHRRTRGAKLQSLAAEPEKKRGTFKSRLTGFYGMTIDDDEPLVPRRKSTQKEMNPCPSTRRRVSSWNVGGLLSSWAHVVSMTSDHCHLLTRNPMPPV